jgi:hypothetical protein
MPRRNRARTGQGRPNGGDETRLPRLGSHWRSDGRPKTGYSSQADALTAALVRRQESSVELNVYVCDVCSKWHMGKPTSAAR